MRFFSTKTCGRQAKKRHSYASRLMAFRNFRGLRFEPLEERMLLSVIQWTGDGDGKSWSNQLNWAGDAVPGPNDDAVIGPAFAAETITSATNVTIHSLTSEASFQITAGTLTVGTTTEVDNTFTIGGGTLAAQRFNRGAADRD